MSKVIRVVPVQACDGVPTKTHGTQCYVGEEKLRVQKLTLIAEPGNVWRAIIETTVQLDGEVVAALAAPPEQQAPPPPPPRVLCGACGDVTHKRHGWLCRAMAALDRWTGMANDKVDKA